MSDAARSIPRSPLRAGLLFAALSAVVPLGGLVAGGCDPEPQTGARVGAPPVDPALLAFLSRARAAHHLADLLEDQGRPERAITELEGILAGPAPAAPALPEVQEVHADTHARLADLKSQQGEFEAAEKHLDAGLTLAPEVTYLRGHLFEVRGLLEERRAKAADLAAKEIEERVGTGPASEADRTAVEGLRTLARAARTRAVQAFETTMEIQARVIERTAPPKGTE